MVKQGRSIVITCVHCGSEDPVKFGVAPNGTQRYRCKACGKTFVETYTSEGYKPSVKAKIIDMALDGTGVRATSRLLGITQNTVINNLRKKSR